MDEIMTIEQINERFDSEWVLVDEPQTDEKLKVLGGRVRFHSKDRNEVYNQVTELAIPRRFSVLYTGKIPPGTRIWF
jgi:hypothetical protein